MNKIKKIILKKTAFTDRFHPWVYKNHIAVVDPEISPGDIVSIISHDNAYLGTGYYNPKSVIAIRILSRKKEPIDNNFFNKYIFQAFQKREQLKKITNAFRIVSSEADSLPGLILDLYNNTVVFQITTLGMKRLKNEIISSIHNTIKPEYIFERSDSIMCKLEGFKPAVSWHGLQGKEKTHIHEGKGKFIVDIAHGHKTGFYLDQRKSRIAVENFAKNKKVLDIFSYTGGFAIHAALGMASKVVCIDIKNEWLEQLKYNAQINNVSEKIECIKGNAFNILRKYIQTEEIFDIIILDPPSFVKNKSGLQNAVKGYLELNRLAMRLLNNKGILCTFSCSHHMKNEIFSDMLKKAAEAEIKTFSILKRCHQDKDHPIIETIPETEYLKGYFLSIINKN
ncbi:MAG: class I SAM-dependent rRNA methyltransferase [Spirochaetes bacterium]|nr:class I SAM-dependent rRNA methyltransferase [Spirochaetota bacterium]